MSQTDDTPSAEPPGQLTGQLLIAMPSMPDRNFARSVVYLCAHSSDGAMGLIINRCASDITFAKLLDQIKQANPRVKGLTPPGDGDGGSTDMPVHVGGPVEAHRGFVLHSGDYAGDDTTLKVRDGICLTATIDVLRAIVRGRGPKHALVALGYAGWSAGQLEAEIQANGWLHADADTALVFDTPAEDKYDRSLARIGIDPGRLSNIAGHA